MYIVLICSMILQCFFSSNTNTNITKKKIIPQRNTLYKKGKLDNHSERPMDDFLNTSENKLPHFLND